MPINSILEDLSPFFGAILVVFGLALNLLGHRFIDQLFGMIMGILVSGLVFMLSYTIILPIEVQLWQFILLLSFCLLIGGLVTIQSTKFLGDYLDLILGGLSTTCFAIVCLQYINVNFDWKAVTGVVLSFGIGVGI